MNGLSLLISIVGGSIIPDWGLGGEYLATGAAGQFTLAVEDENRMAIFLNPTQQHPGEIAYYYVVVAAVYFYKIARNRATLSYQSSNATCM